MTPIREFQNILLAALGTTPQIITESLYHLMVEKKIFIHEIHLITTMEGRKRAENQLFQNGAGPFFQFCQEYSFSSTDLPPRYHIIENSLGEKLSDIRTPADNQIAADYFLKVVREFTARKDTRIFATIAGGRKTMSAYLYLTMQLLGRDQDTLYHVLVHPETLESNPAFYYPRKDVEEIEFLDKEKKPFTVPVKDIRIDMAEIPFVKIRRILREGVIDSISKFTELVDLTQSELDKAQFEPEVEINLLERALFVMDRRQSYRIPLRPIQMCLYAYLGEKGSLLNSKAGDQQAIKEILKIYRLEYAIAGVNESSFNCDRLMQMRSKINRAIRKIVYPPLLQEFLLIHSEQKYGEGATFYLKLSPSKIRITSSNSQNHS